MLALLFDVHGNLAALDAVLADAERQGADRYLLGGDHVAFGPEPTQVLERLRGLPGATWIRGNADRWLGDASDAPAPMDAAARATAGAVGVDAAAWLTRLDPAARIDDDTIAWHASFEDDMTGFAPEAQDGEVELIDPSARRMVVGHTHLQFLRDAKDGTTICNPGSVGIPLDGDARAAYGLLRESGTIELRRVPYDNVAAAERLRARFDGAWVDVVASAGPELDAVVVLLRDFLHVSGALRAVAMVDRPAEGPAVVDCGRLLPIEVDLGDRLLHLPHAIELDAVAPPLPPDIRQLPPFEVDPATGEVTSIVGGLQHAVRATQALAEALGGRNVALAAFPTTPTEAQLSITARADGSERPLVALGDEEFELPEEAQD